MSDEALRDRQVRLKTRQVAEYHYDETRPGKPLHLLIPGGLIALGSLAIIVVIAWRTWLAGTFDEATATTLLILLAPIYVGGVFLFSYGYELYDLPRALRLTAIIVFITLAALVIVGSLGALLGGGSKSRSSSSKSDSSESKSSSGSKSPSGRSSRSTSISSSPGGGSVELGGRSGTRTVTREVPAKHTKPQPISCPNCRRPYLPEENNFACPACGAPAPAQSRSA
jgi:uncharacterized membrane protein YgcG